MGNCCLWWAPKKNLSTCAAPCHDVRPCWKVAFQRPWKPWRHRVRWELPLGDGVEGGFFCRGGRRAIFPKVGQSLCFFFGCLFVFFPSVGLRWFHRFSFGDSKYCGLFLMYAVMSTQVMLEKCQVHRSTVCWLLSQEVYTTWKGSMAIATPSSVGENHGRWPLKTNRHLLGVVLRHLLSPQCNLSWNLGYWAQVAFEISGKHATDISDV